jgi:uncharacterized protein
VRIEVVVKPGKRVNQVVETAAGLSVNLRAVPENGKANAALICVLADHFKVPKHAVTIASGQTSRRKLVEIAKNPA